MNAVTTIPIEPISALEPEDQARAGLYAVIGNLLYRAPDQAMLDLAAGLGGQADASTPLGEALAELGREAAAADPQALRPLFENIFIGVGKPRVMPYASYFLTGFLNEKPLAALRASLAELGLGRREGVGEPEDHLAAMCDAMRLLIGRCEGGDEAAWERQVRFFQEQIQPWYEKLCDELEGLADAPLYRALGKVMRRFFEVEAQAAEYDVN